MLLPSRSLMFWLTVQPGVPGVQPPLITAALPMRGLTAARRPQLPSPVPPAWPAPRLRGDAL